MNIETHPFGNFIPGKISYLFLGSFTSKDAKKGVDYDWYYSNGRNQYWSLIEQVYDIKLNNKKDKVKLFDKLEIGIADVIYLPSPSPRYAAMSKDEKVSVYKKVLPPL